LLYDGIQMLAVTEAIDSNRLVPVLRSHADELNRCLSKTVPEASSSGGA
jgi:hypothetical protein